MEPSPAKSHGRLRAELARLERLALSDIPLPELEAAVSDVLRHHDWKTRPLRVPRAYRARPCPPRAPQLHDVWYPPPHQVTDMGRANAQGESILYLADRESTALSEVHAQPGESIVVLEVGSSPAAEPLRVLEISVDRLEWQASAAAPAKGRDPARSDAESTRDALVRRFLVHHFTRPVPPGREEEYKLCVAISRLQRRRAVDGLWYPSAAGEDTGTTVALQPAAADRCLRPRSCWLGDVVQSDDGELSLRRRAECQSIREDGTIVW